MSNRKQVAKSRKRVHIISRDKGWAIKKEGLSRASQIRGNKEAAIKGAKKLKRRGFDIVVHRKDGSIERWEKSKR
jgi:hypothetical protein